MDTSSTLVSAPLFLVGSERSGTTLLRLMLDHHPELAFELEFEYVVQMVGDDGAWPDLDSYYEWLSTDRIYLSRRYDIDKRLSYPQLVNDFLVQRRTLANKPLVGATVHSDFDRLPRIWPDARFIHLLRDGRDVARSVMELGWAGNTWTAIERWIKAEETWETVKQTLGPDRAFEVRYEELVQRPEETLTEICRFVGIEYNPAMLRYPEDSTYSTPDPKLIYQWSRKLSEPQIRLAEARAGSWLVRRGYKLSGLPPIEVDEKMKRALVRQCKQDTRKVRLNRYGLLLVGTDYLARKLRLAGLAKHTRKRIHAIDNSLLK
jgi:Sulfotransferase family